MMPNTPEITILHMYNKDEAKGMPAAKLGIALHKYSLNDIILNPFPVEHLSQLLVFVFQNKYFNPNKSRFLYLLINGTRGIWHSIQEI